MLLVYKAFVPTSSGFRKSIPALLEPSEVEKLSMWTARHAGLAIEFYHCNGTSVQWIEKPTKRGSLPHPSAHFLPCPCSTDGLWGRHLDLLEHECTSWLELGFSVVTAGCHRPPLS